MNKLSIFFWSGTGNSYRIASHVKHISEDLQCSAELLSMDIAHNKIQITPYTAFVFPVHGFTTPWHVIKFALRMPRGNSNSFFCITARGALKFGKIIVPGISGTAGFLISALLFLKGYRVSGQMSINTPSNWYLLHPVQSSEKHQAINQRLEEKISSFINKIYSGKKVWLTLNNFYEFTFGLMLSYVSLAYLLIGRFFLSKLFFATDKCNGCGVCVQYCPAGAVILKGKNNPKPYWKFSCESCMRCSAFCPPKAIEAGHSWGVLLYFLAAIPLSAYIFSMFNLSNLTEIYWLNKVINILFYYPVIFLSYLVFQFITRFASVNRFFALTTFTHLSSWGRYHEIDTKLKELRSSGSN